MISISVYGGQPGLTRENLLAETQFAILHPVLNLKNQVLSNFCTSPSKNDEKNRLYFRTIIDYNLSLN